MVKVLFAFILFIVLSESLCHAGSSVIYTDNGANDQTLIYSSLPKWERREMQQEILTLLGLHHRPKPKNHRKQNSAPQYLIDLYKSFLDEESGNLKVDLGKLKSDGQLFTQDGLRAINDSDLIMSFENRIHHHSPHLRHERHRRFWFDVSEVSPEQDIMKAELRLFLDINQNHHKEFENYTLNLSFLTEGSSFGEIRTTVVETKEIWHEQSGWLVFNVTEPMVTWVAFPDKNLGLYLDMKVAGLDQDIDPHEVGIVGADGKENRQPFMVSFFKTPTNLNIRQRRSPRRRTSNRDQQNWSPYTNTGIPFHYPSKRSCQKRTLFVSFQDLGWQDWIIAPDGYAASYCQGECAFPLNTPMNATNHAIVQTLVHLMDPTKVPQPCCAPTDLSQISMLYFDDNQNVVLKKYPNMAVKSCGCH